MSQSAEFPTGEFTAFSTAKMSHFLLVQPGVPAATLSQFFGENAQYVTQAASGTLTLQLPGSPLLVGKVGDLFGRFANEKFKVISADYYHHNFNDPLTDEHDTGITED